MCGALDGGAIHIRKKPALALSGGGGGSLGGGVFSIAGGGRLSIGVLKGVVFDRDCMSFSCKLPSNASRVSYFTYM